ncbi:MAG: coenzyme F420-0:L-glutamate ligase [Candidatus Bathyarchaeota archaeon]|nr:coenzyme F420-0:L-glutamate ligase [Candidatus Bathyarchaeota archaeon]
MVKYKALAIKTGYWKPKEDYHAKIAKALAGRVLDGDFVVISEKAVSTAQGNIIDEAQVKPSLSAKFLARVWMQLVWGYFLGALCHFGPRLIRRLREYPIESGGKHKQVILQYAGLFQALLFGSEGGIDGSNLPYSYVSMPLKNPQETAEQIRGYIQATLNRRVCIIIVDTDKTYLFRNFYFTPLPHAVKGIPAFGGLFTYLVGRVLRFKKSSTPLAVAGCRFHAGESLKIANIADHVRGAGSGATVWDMAARFGVEVSGVSYDMLANVKHKPVVIVRKTPR